MEQLFRTFGGWLVPVVILAVIVLPQAIRILREYERAVVFRWGRLAGASIMSSSGYADLDNDALNVVQATAPFEPLPEYYDLSRLHILASFGTSGVDITSVINVIPSSLEKSLTIF